MPGTNAPVRIALFGESDVGKTHYGGQLLTRIDSEKCQLRMRAAPSDLTPFEEVRSCLNAGVPAAHTPSAVYRESVWPVVTQDGTQLDLTWPDYAGEQVRHLIDGRRMGQDWLERVQEAHGWMLMVRPKLVKQDDDIFSRPLGDIRRSPSDAASKPKRSTQARLVELLQMLLYARRLGTRRERPALIVLLSCWDELGRPEGTKPWAVLQDTLPLVAAFVRNQWSAQHGEVFGLSALEKALSAERPNEEFVDKGPEHFGYVVLPDGTKNPDLTLPIAQIKLMALG